MLRILKLTAIIGAIAYGFTAFVYPILPIVKGEPDKLRIDFFFYYWPIVLFALLTFLPNKVLLFRKSLKIFYIVLAIFSTVIVAGMVCERLMTSFYGTGSSPAKIAFITSLFFSLCASWLSFSLCYRAKIKASTNLPVSPKNSGKSIVHKSKDEQKQ